MRRPPLSGVRCTIAIAALVLAGCGSAVEPASPAGDDGPGAVVGGADDPTTTVRPELAGPGDAVLVVGDSLTVGASDVGDLPGRLRRAGFEDVTVLAEEGRDPSWGLEQIEELDAVPPLVVVELGTNRSANPTGFADQVDAIVGALRERGARRIAWVTPVSAEDDRYRDKTDILHAAAGVDLVAAWDEVVHAEPALMGDDGLHPTEAGYGRLAAFLATTASDLAA